MCILGVFIFENNLFLYYNLLIWGVDMYLFCPLYCPSVRPSVSHF